MAEDIASAYAQERDLLLHDLAQLGEREWAHPSWCPGWDVRDVVAHLMMPYELGVAGVIGRMFTSRFSFDRLALKWARSDRRTPTRLLRALAATNVVAFTVPGAGPLAPLCHLSIHAQDIRGPLGIKTPVSPAAARQVLDDIVLGKHAVPAQRIDGLRLEATDAQWSVGRGMNVSGPAGALMSALSGRALAVDQLAGDGCPTLRQRLETGPAGS